MDDQLILGDEVREHITFDKTDGELWVHVDDGHAMASYLMTAEDIQKLMQYLGV